MLPYSAMSSWSPGPPLPPPPVCFPALRHLPLVSERSLWPITYNANQPWNVWYVAYVVWCRFIFSIHPLARKSLTVLSGATSMELRPQGGKSRGSKTVLPLFCSWDHIVPCLTRRVLLRLWLFTPAAQRSQIEIEAVIAARGRESQKAPEGTRAGRRLAMCEWSRALHHQRPAPQLGAGDQIWAGDLETRVPVLAG